MTNQRIVYNNDAAAVEEPSTSRSPAENHQHVEPLLTDESADESATLATSLRHRSKARSRSPVALRLPSRAKLNKENGVVVDEHTLANEGLRLSTLAKPAELCGGAPRTPWLPSSAALGRRLLQRVPVAAAGGSVRSSSRAPGAIANSGGRNTAARAASAAARGSASQTRTAGSLRTSGAVGTAARLSSPTLASPSVASPSAASARTDVSRPSIGTSMELRVQINGTSAADADGTDGNVLKSRLGVAGGRGCTDIARQQVDILFENTAPPYKPPPVEILEEQKPLIECLHNIRRCDSRAQMAALELPSLSRLALERFNPYDIFNGTHKLQVTASKKYRSCAVVGNSGHLLETRRGQWIDRHEMVLRFNRQGIKGYERHVGSRTTHRIINLSDGTAVCCRGALPELEVNVEKTRRWPTLVFWHPALQDQVMANCRLRFRSPTHGLGRAYVRSQVRLFQALRRDLLNLGFGPFNDKWRQMTGGGHGILMALGLCESVSLYGFTTYPTSERGKDQYDGNSVRQASSGSWHDWEGEQHAWRLLHAAGFLNICSM
ncbi:hypothetical protein CYMTET_47910 [Cymbomonas tetramitiformis]|uniref:Uncharacterized protein n=1 Tax=Cymbomonas tetramitiformis TaxID=36881 RepID=A0AAE0BV82_9CHLO|nr:hypothetical protein CYMTET_47910 [Cymbomonas tetramitiformis]